MGYQAGDTNLYRFVGNDPTNATDPSGLVEVLGSWPNCDTLRVEPKYTEHDIEWYARLWDRSNPDMPRIALTSYVGFDVVSESGGIPKLKAKPVAGAFISFRSIDSVLSQFKTETNIDKKEYHVFYTLLVKGTTGLVATLKCEWKFTVDKNKIDASMLYDKTSVKDGTGLQWDLAFDAGKTNRETYTKQWQETAADEQLYGLKK